MIENEESRKNGWTRSETKSGYLSKTLKYNNCTIIINRPFLTPEEQKKREKEVIRDVSFPLSKYIFKKQKSSDVAEQE